MKVTANININDSEIEHELRRIVRKKIKAIIRKELDAQTTKHYLSGYVCERIRRKVKQEVYGDLGI